MRCARVCLTILVALPHGGALASSASAWQRRVAVLRNATSVLRAARPTRTPEAPFDRMGDARLDTAPLPDEVVTSPRPEDYLRTEDLPESWDWRSVKVADDAPPVHFTTRVRNQFLPLWCGSCWAHAATAVLGSRWLIHANDTSASGIDFSVQFLVNCVDGTEAPPHHHVRGCGGGSSFEAFAHAHKFGVVDSSCLPYRAVTQNCSAQDTCEQNLHGHGPHPKLTTADPIRYHVREFGYVGGAETAAAAREEMMRKEVYARGPVAACMACPSEFEDEYTGGIFAAKSARAVCDHIVAIVGFGGTGASAYWVVQNSFGSVWGEQGYFRIKRSSALGAGEHNLGIESARVSWAMPA